ncbi:MAG TPA: NAD-dependent epimerase/dehydratase family protein, partial [Flavisolibacter sp.]|nr:NAD-dependent epimerase/dehydratase family protein [Flavisolibacter sp.]
MKRTALVIGATGLVGNELVHQLLVDNRFDTVLVFVRRSTGISNIKLQEHIINFDEPQSWSDLVKG